MNLEVKGSNPFTHPLQIKTDEHHSTIELWTLVVENFVNKFIKKDDLNSLFKLDYYQKCWLEITKSFVVKKSKSKLPYAKSILKKFSIKRMFTGSYDLQLNFKLKNNLHSIDSVHNIECNKKEGGMIHYLNNNESLQTFIPFLIVNLETTQPKLIPNATSQSFYFSHANGGSKIINVSKLLKKWLDFYNLVFNLFYYKTKTLTFTPASHNKEAISLNWGDFNQVWKLWRYSKPFLLNKPNTINDDGDFIFRKLKLKGWSTGVVSDITYHSKTLIYLRRAGFFTLASLPSMYNDSFLDFFLPSTSDTLLTQSYFLRTLIKIKNSATNIYSSFLFSERIITF